jgi:anaerobic ribonucleoside-triphosphate reductase
MNEDIELRYKEMCEHCNVEYEPSVNNTEQIDTTYGEGVGFQRLRRITGYLVGDVSRWNNGKKAELNDRVKHDKDSRLE